MAPDHPFLTVAIAMVVLLGLVLSATRPPGVFEDGAGTENTAERSEADEERLPATGEPDQLTVVSPDALPGIEETEIDHDGGADVTAAYPNIPNAAPLSDFLDRTLTAQVNAFEAANPGARSFVGEWGITAAAEGIVGVRTTTTETDSEETREGHSTHWYETGDGTVNGSSHLLAGQAELAELNDLVREAVADTGADPSALHPISALYDSVGFNPDGDLVVEFDSGQVAPTDVGRVHAVIDRDEAEALLSEFGLRVREAATTGTREFTVAEAPEADKDGSGAAAPGVLAPRDDSVDCADPDTKCVALTYDDGPGGRTPELLDALAEYDAHATFFVTGHPVMEHPWVVRRTYAEGHELANHTLSHPNLAEIGSGAARSDLETTQALVFRETGYTMDLMRPPYGSTNGQVAEITAELGLAQILWSVDTNDWRDRKANVVRKRALKGASEGAIILMHDIHDTTIDASIDIIRELDARGYTMVTVSQLLGTTVPGETYVDGVPEPPETEGSEESEENSEEGAVNDAG
ncbi:polysaccharide deacetylase family protein [Nocardiopsis ganjiahuensis]|uniref:polysaccharide deacetylase family protein n=1 Tax=Nocardiopsis ganjiahuensis TaxID=239984 RepID=UPI00036A4E4F|nr:polysaccharide deacetylase family protein [Nocardiopsis ganjiahuensis]